MPAATPLPRGPSVLTLYSAADLLTAPGCPVCRYAGEASERYLHWFALEGHADPGMITRLCTSLGMCAVHTRRLMSQPGSAVRLTAVYRYVVTAARDQVARRAQPPTACPGCEHDDAATRRALDTLLEDFTDTAVLDRCRTLGGLCLPHLAAAAAAARPGLVAALAESLRDTIAARGSRLDWLTGTDHDAEARGALRRAMPPAGSPSQTVCWPCLAGAQAERDALARLPGLASDGPDPALVLCANHLADAVAAAGDIGIWPLLAWQTQCLTSRLPAERSWRWRAAARRLNLCGACGVCSARQTAAQRALTSVRSWPYVGTEAIALCVRHHLVLGAADPRSAGELARDTIRRADQIAAELASAFDRAAWAHSHSARAPQSTAWQRAAAFLDGSVFGGGPVRPPG
jgi:hypothetical protein